MILDAGPNTCSFQVNCPRSTELCGQGSLLQHQSGSDYTNIRKGNGVKCKQRAAHNYINTLPKPNQLKLKKKLYKAEKSYKNNNNKNIIIFML